MPSGPIRAWRPGRPIRPISTPCRPWTGPHEFSPPILARHSGRATPFLRAKPISAKHQRQGFHLRIAQPCPDKPGHLCPRSPKPENLNPKTSSFSDRELPTVPTGRFTPMIDTRVHLPKSKFLRKAAKGYFSRAPTSLELITYFSACLICTPQPAPTLYRTTR
jgi:hypothetical protein